MPKAILVLLWVFVFTTPWDNIELPLVGSVSRLAGMAVLGAAVLAIILKGAIRKPDWVFLATLACGAWAALSLLWTDSFGATFSFVFSFAQLVVLVGIVREFVRTSEDEEAMFGAFFLGCFVPMASVLYNYYNKVDLSTGDRYSANSLNADDLALTLVIGLPMAWHVIRHRHGLLRVLAAVYFMLAPLSTLLTGTRGAFLAGLVALSLVPLTVGSRISFSRMARAALLFAIVVSTSFMVVPDATWKRISTITTELLEGGRLTGRRAIWSAGAQVIPEHPYIGVGAGGFGHATQSLLNTERTAAHNFFLTILVELGAVGLALFLFLFLTTGLTIAHMPSPTRKLWSVVMLTWLVGVMGINWEIRKTTWLLFGLVAAHGTLDLGRRRQTAFGDRSVTGAGVWDAERVSEPVWVQSRGRVEWAPHTTQQR